MSIIPNKNSFAPIPKIGNESFPSDPRLFRSGKLMLAVSQSYELDGLDKLLLHEILNMDRDKGESLFAPVMTTQSGLMGRCGMARTTLKRRLNSLHERGYIFFHTFESSNPHTRTTIWVTSKIFDEFAAFLAEWDEIEEESRRKDELEGSEE